MYTVAKQKENQAMASKGKAIIRRDVTNPKKWVFEVYYADRPYPNVISARYKNKRNAKHAAWDYLTFGAIDFYPENKGL